MVEKARLIPAVIKVGTSWSSDGGNKDITELGQIIENEEEIAEILPTQSGFFFGNTEYDNYYLQDTIDTITDIEQMLEEDKDREQYVEYYYRSSW